MKPPLDQLRNFPAPLRIVAFLLLLGIIWLPFAIPIALWSRDPNQTTIWAMMVLFVEFLLLVRWWGRQIHHERQVFQTYGLTLNRISLVEGLQGLGWGTASLLLLFLVQSLVGWVSWRPPQVSFGQIILEGLLVALGVGLAEELVFRGWILDELQRDYSPGVALWANSGVFAALHFIKPLPEIIRTFPQFPGLVLLGAILVWMKRSTRSQQRTAVKLITHNGRLGLPIGFHAGLVWGYYLLKVGGLVTLTNRVPAWVTGIDENPLAGLVGLLFLASLAIYWRRRSAKTWA
ncbi:CPBP family intramembrane glutamic endopeptidase [Leptolyngbya sp. 7M]|uniref:CPBP family intramembrane glutamic endopeptidase n=1 Tax=Leptolyngbya sp. 7M TaxID=2812896 RepID=UPI001CECBFB7|nr:type II CAAX endopeptidase family protein [Leptolyngbya sp. 7M]